MSGGASSSTTTSTPNCLQQKLLEIERKLKEYGLLVTRNSALTSNAAAPSAASSNSTTIVVPTGFKLEPKPLLTLYGRTSAGAMTSPLPRRPLPLSAPANGQSQRRSQRPQWTMNDLNNGTPPPPVNRHSRHSHSEQTVENERRLREITDMSGKLRIEGKEYKCEPQDLQSLGELGHGTCGHVMKMRHQETGYILAVKQMRRSGNKEENKRIIMDLDVVLRSHGCDYIVKCLGCFITDSDVWICMELMATCLDKLIRRIRSGIPETILGKMAVSVVKALLYLKEKQGIIHRDVKPSNMLLDWTGTIKLCDFGISGRLVDSKAKTRTAGCAAYMAPERIDPPDPSNADYDTRADVWSFGISLVELATGRFPYEGCTTDFELLTRILQEQPPSLTPQMGFSPEFCEFVSVCLTKDLKLRPKYRQLLEHPFLKRYENESVDVASWFQRAMENSPSPDGNRNIPIN